MSTVLETDIRDLAMRLLSFPTDEYYTHPRVTAEECLMVCRTAIMQLSQASEACVQVASPINIVGDIHGQFHDLLRIFDRLGQPPQSKYIFLGDYVDRGKYSLEVIVLLLSLMLLHPGSVTMLRGNHETSNVCCRYGFKDELYEHFGPEMGNQVLRGFTRCFQFLPLVGLINRQIFCCHGGLSPYFEIEPFVKGAVDENIAALNNIIQPSEPMQFGVACDLLWSDPMAQPQLGAYGSSEQPMRLNWVPGKRGCSYNFSYEALESTLQCFGTHFLVRGHQVASEGYMMNLNRRCTTVFSAPGYSGTHDNCGAVLQLDRVINFRKPGNFSVFTPIDNKPLHKLFWL